MDRIEWGETTGDDHRIVDDLRWALFQAERSIHSMKHGYPVILDRDLTRTYERQVIDCKIAIAALWSVEE